MKTRYDRNMMTVRITEAELARQMHAVLEKVQQGSEVIVEREDHRPVAIIRSPLVQGRLLSDTLHWPRPAAQLQFQMKALWKMSQEE
jgi:hypothetical protein